MPMIAIMAQGLSTALRAQHLPTSLSSPQDVGQLQPGVVVSLDVRALQPIHSQAALSLLCIFSPV